MEENSKVIVFEKKEVGLIVLFVVLLTATSFTLGVRMGMKWQLSSEGITEEDIKNVELKSQREEETEKVLNTQETEEKPEIKDEAFDKLQKEFEKLDDKGVPAKLNESVDLPSSESPAADKLIESYEVTKPVAAVAETAPATQTISNVVNAAQYSGKYTIQVGAYNNLDEASQFASGFEVRGYTPVIQEAEIAGKGKWYRVSIGIFENRQAAKDYIVEQKSLFQGYDYIINKID
jgi:septal ring-binding cell division protein DamX